MFDKSFITTLYIVLSMQNKLEVFLSPGLKSVDMDRPPQGGAATEAGGLYTNTTKKNFNRGTRWSQLPT